MNRLLPICALLLWLALPCCTRESSPQQTVESAMEAARDGDLERFLSHFESRSARRLALYWSLSSHYGYLRERALEFLEDLTVVQTHLHGDNATVVVKDSRKDGVICLTKEENRWLINLLGTCQRDSSATHGSGS